MVPRDGIEPSTRGFSKFHRHLIRKYFNHLYRRNRGAVRVQQASIFDFYRNFYVKEFELLDPDTYDIDVCE